MELWRRNQGNIGIGHLSPLRARMAISSPSLPIVSGIVYKQRPRPTLIVLEPPGWSLLYQLVGTIGLPQKRALQACVVGYQSSRLMIGLAQSPFGNGSKAKQTTNPPLSHHNTTSLLPPNTSSPSLSLISRSFSRFFASLKRTLHTLL